MEGRDLFKNPIMTSTVVRYRPQTVYTITTLVANRLGLWAHAAHVV